MPIDPPLINYRLPFLALMAEVGLGEEGQFDLLAPERTVTIVKLGFRSEGLTLFGHDGFAAFLVRTDHGFETKAKIDLSSLPDWVAAADASFYAVLNGVYSSAVETMCQLVEQAGDRLVVEGDDRWN